MSQKQNSLLYWLLFGGLGIMLGFAAWQYINIVLLTGYIKWSPKAEAWFGAVVGSLANLTLIHVGVGLFVRRYSRAFSLAGFLLRTIVPLLLLSLLPITYASTVSAAHVYQTPIAFGLNFTQLYVYLFGIFIGLAQVIALRIDRLQAVLWVLAWAAGWALLYYLSGEVLNWVIRTPPFNKIFHFTYMIPLLNGLVAVVLPVFLAAVLVLRGGKLEVK